jgi:hypothetical protein
MTVPATRQGLMDHALGNGPIQLDLRSMAEGNRHAALGAVSLLAGGLCFAAFPLLRETGALEGGSIDAAAVAAEVAAPMWVISHMVAVFGFLLLLPGFIALNRRLESSHVERAAVTGFVLCMFGSALLACFISVEALGLRAFGLLQPAGKADVNAGVVLLRSGPSIALFAPGLLFTAAGAVMTGIAMWRSARFSKWAVLAFAIGLAATFPVLPYAVRVGDHLLVAAGALGLARDLSRADA